MNKKRKGPSDEMHVPKVSSLAVAVATHKKFAPGVSKGNGRKGTWGKAEVVCGKLRKNRVG